MLKLIIQRLLTCIFLLAFSVGAFSQAEVVEAGSTITQPNSSATTPSAQNDSNDIVLNLYLQLEALQQEVQTLRGTVEEQSYQIRRMQADSRDRYLDMDNRLSNLSNTTIEPNMTEPSQNQFNERVNTTNTLLVDTEQRQTTTMPAPSVTTNNSTAQPLSYGVGEPTSTTSLAMPENEQELYRTALNLLIEESHYADSIILFQQYIDVYSTGRYIANAYYWQGEALILAERFNQAKDVFTTVINEYPQHAKAPGALLKLVVTYLQMNNDLQAQEALSTLQAQYPDSLTEINAAQQYLRDAGL